MINRTCRVNTDDHILDKIFDSCTGQLTCKLIMIWTTKTNNVEQFNLKYIADAQLLQLEHTTLIIVIIIIVD